MLHSTSYFYTPITPDYSKGVYFTFQDQWYSGVGGGPYDTKYFGEGFSCCATYDSKFVNYHGNCDGFYGHTWNSTYVTGVSLSNSGWSINFGGGSNSQPYNSFDTGF